MPFLSELIGNYRRFSQRQALAAVQDDDLDAVLGRLGILGAVNQGLLACANCGGQVTRLNLSGFVKDGEQLRVYCDRTSCLVGALYPSAPKDTPVE
jgi:hypothetical protein